jgi:hypothetical protein
MPKLSFPVLFAALTFAMSASLPAQAPNAGLFGHLTDGSGEPIPNAVVVLCNADAGLWFMTSTDAGGAFALAGTPLNRFAIEVLSPQWRRSTVTNGRGQVWGYSPWSDIVVLQPGQNLQRNIQLGGLVLQPRTTQTTPPCTPRRPYATLGAAGLARFFVDGPGPAFPKGTNGSTQESDVNLEAIMNKDGKVISLRLIVSSWPPKIDPALTKAAVEAVRQWRYNRPVVNITPEPLEFGGLISVQFPER